MNKYIKMSVLTLTTLTLFWGSQLIFSDANINNSTVLAAKKTKPAVIGKVIKHHDLNVKITKWQVIPIGEKGNEYGSKPIIAFWYEVKNKATKKISPDYAWLTMFDVSQYTNHSQEHDLQSGDAPDERYADTGTTKIAKGKTGKSAVAYELDSVKRPVIIKAHTKYDEKITNRQKIAVKEPFKQAQANAKNPWSFKDDIFHAGKMTYKINRTEVIPNLVENGTKTLLIHMDVTNHSKDYSSPGDIYLNTDAYQNTDTSRVALDSGMSALDEDGDFVYKDEEEALANELLPGKTAQIVVSYNLKNDNDVELDFLSENIDRVVGKKTIQVQ